METFQGAEATVEINEEVRKTRKKKKYRHRDLDQKLRKERTKTEAHLLEEASRAGANVPKVLEEKEAELLMQKIDGPQLKNVLEEENMEELGENVAALHSADIIHGDLTTSNAIVSDKVYLIDFGLAYRSQRIEDKAVDIHLLKQVLESSHPELAEKAWKSFVGGYQNYDKSEAILEQLKEVEKRGRYK